MNNRYTMTVKLDYIVNDWKLRVRKNRITGVKTVNGEKFSKDYLDDLHTELMERKAEDENVPYIGRKTLEQILNSLAFRNQFDPVLEDWGYNTSTGEWTVEWDGMDRLTSFGSTYLGTETTHVQNVSAALLVRGMVWRYLKPGLDFPYAPIIYSYTRGMGKSMALRYLAGEEFYNGSFSPSHFDNEKTVGEKCRGKTIVEIAEVDELNQKGVRQLDGFLTTPHLTARYSYEAHAEDTKVNWIWVKTSNDPTVIKRPDVNRRDLVIVVERPVDLEAIKRDRLQLIAQARHEFETARPTPTMLTLPKEMWEEQAEIADGFREQSPMEVVLRTYMSERETATAQEIQNVLRDQLGRIYNKDLGRIMGEIGYVSKVSKGTRKWVKIG